MPTVAIDCTPATLNYIDFDEISFRSAHAQVTDFGDFF